MKSIISVFVGVLYALAAWSAAAVPVQYNLSGLHSSEIEGPIQTIIDGGGFPSNTNNFYSSDQTINVTLTYDNGIAGFPAAGGLVFLNAQTGMSGAVGSDSFSDPAGFAFLLNNTGNDLFLLNADAGVELDGFARDFSGFTTVDGGGQAWEAVNLRIFFSGGEFLSDDSLPTSLLGIGSDNARIALDFWDMAPEFDTEGNVTNGARLHSAFFDVTNISQVPIPAAAWLFGSALLTLGVIKRRKR